jgi:hypothetical protein
MRERVHASGNIWGRGQRHSRSHACMHAKLKGLIGCPHIGQPGSQYAAVVCLVVGCIHVTRRVLLCRLFGLPHMHQRLCLAMQKKSSGQALEMRPKSAHLWSQAHAMHSQAAAGLARSAMLPRYGNQSGPKLSLMRRAPARPPLHPSYLLYACRIADA